MRFQRSHCVVRVRDLKAMVAFYCDVFDFEVSDRGFLGPDGPQIVFLSGSSSDHHQIAFTPTRGDEDASSLEHSAFRVESLDAVRTVLERVQQDDRVRRIDPITHGNAISIYFSDPERNGIEIFCDTPWHVSQPQIDLWDPNSTNEEVLAAIETKFGDNPEFMSMELYRAERAKAFGEQ